MRIIYLHQYFNTPKMFGGTRSYEIAKRLSNGGHEIHMITTQRNGNGCGRWYRTQEDGIHVHWLPLSYANQLSYRDRIRAFARFAVRAGLYARHIKADLVFATSTPLTIALPAVYISKVQKIPMVFEVRDLWPELPIAVGAISGPLIPPARWLEQSAYRNSARIIALSPGMKKGIMKAGYPGEQIHIIPNSCDIDLFQVPPEAGFQFRRRFEWLGQRPLVVYAGTFGRINNVGYIARLAAETHELAPEMRFLVVGGGYEQSLVADLARQLGVLDKNFFMLPSLPKDDMPALLSAATVSLSTFIDLPQMWVNSANKFFDSLAAARPVAINYGGWQAELLRKTGAGIVLPANDAESGARLLANAMTKAGWVEKAGAAAFSLARKEFSRNQLAQQFEQVLLSAIENRTPRCDCIPEAHSEGAFSVRRR